MKTLQELFPRASLEFLKANEGVLNSIADEIETVDKISSIQVSPKRKRRGTMNNTEREFSMMLERQKREGEILRFEFEGITLRWADMKYTPDFIVFLNPASDWKGQPTIKLIEVKGAHIWDRDIVRYKGARAYWPEFTFEMWQKTKAEWAQLY